MILGERQWSPRMTHFPTKSTAKELQNPPNHRVAAWGETSLAPVLPFLGLAVLNHGSGGEVNF